MGLRHVSDLRLQPRHGDRELQGDDQEEHRRAAEEDAGRRHAEGVGDGLDEGGQGGAEHAYDRKGEPPEHVPEGDEPAPGEHDHHPAEGGATRPDDERLFQSRRHKESLTVDRHPVTVGGLSKLLKAHNPFPAGSVAIGSGLLVNGVATYASLVVARRVLGPDSYASFAVLWGLVFILAPGLFQPLEQELSRATAERAVRGLGSAPVLRRAAVIGTMGLTVFGALLVASWSLGLGGVLDHDLALLGALLFALVGFMAAELVRGILSGRHRFGRYGAYMAAEGLGRLLIVSTLAALGVRTVGWFGAGLGGAFVLAAAVGIGRRRPFAEPGPEAAWAELTPALGLLLTTSLAEAALLNVGPVAVRALSDDPAAAGRFLNGLIVSRVPLFLFAAIKAALLPNLAHLAESGDMAGFRRLLGRLLGALGLILVASVFGAATLGPWVVELLFDDTLGGRDLALLALTSEGSMVVVTLSLALVALGRARSAALGWAVGAACFPIAVVALDAEPFVQVELALVVAVGVAAITMAVALARTSVIRSAHA